MKRLRARNQSGSLVETPKGEYQAKWYEYVVNPENGQRVRRHRSKILGLVKKMRKCDAQSELKKIVEPLNSSSDAQQDGSVTMNWFLDNEYIPVMSGRWTEGTRSSNVYDIGYIRAGLGEQELRLIALPHLLKLLNHLAQKRKLSESTVGRVYVRLKSILEYARQREFILRNPAESQFYEMPLCRKSAKPFLTKQELRLLWNNIVDPRDHLIMTLAGSPGIRESEVFGLTWPCVHPAHIEIRSSAYRGKLQEFHVKRESSHRNIKLPVQVREELQNWRRVCPQSNMELVFPGRNGGVMWPGTWLEDHIKPIAKKLNIKTPVNFRILRRTFATWNKDRLKDVAGVMGHAGTEIAGRVYAQNVDEHGAELVQSYYDSIMASDARRVQ